MNHSPTKQIPAHYQNLAPYQPGKPIDEVARQSGLQPEDIIKLASNENPAGPSPKAISAATEAMKGSHLYPDTHYFQLIKTLSSHHQLNADCIAVANGSDQCLSWIAQLFSGPEKEVIVSEYAFANFSVLARLNNAPLITAKANKWGHCLDAILSSITPRTRLIFLANPNNPTGTYFTHEELTHFLGKVPRDVMVVCDEAYYEYARIHADYPDTQSLLQNHPNLIITRTFSKIYGLAGLRIGYMMASPEIISWVNRIRLPFIVNLAAEAAAMAAIDDHAHIERSLKMNQDGLVHLQALCSKFQLNHIPSICNFLCIDFGDKAAQINQQLLSQGIIVRPLLPYQMPNHLRISTGSNRELNALESALTEIL